DGNYQVLYKSGTLSTAATDRATASSMTLPYTALFRSGGAIRYTATVSSASASDVAVTLSNGQTITILAGTTSGYVDVAVRADDASEEHTVSIQAESIVASRGRNDETLNKVGRVSTDVA